MVWLFIVVCALLYMLLVFIVYQNQLKFDCAESILVWLEVYIVVSSLHIVRAIAVMLLWAYHKDPIMS